MENKIKTIILEKGTTLEEMNKKLIEIGMTEITRITKQEDKWVVECE